MKIIARIIEMILRMILHVVSWLIVPLLGTLNVLLFLVLGAIGVFGFVVYWWLMWGVGTLVFDHAPGATHKALHMIEHAGTLFVATCLCKNGTSSANDFRVAHSAPC